jgi:hypothetical protein
MTRSCRRPEWRLDMTAIPSCARADRASDATGWEPGAPGCGCRARLSTEPRPPDRGAVRRKSSLLDPMERGAQSRRGARHRVHGREGWLRPRGSIPACGSEMCGPPSTYYAKLDITADSLIRLRRPTHRSIERLHLFPSMHWGLEDSVGHYLDVSSAVLGLTLFPIRSVFHARATQRPNNDRPSVRDLLAE